MFKRTLLIKKKKKESKNDFPYKIVGYYFHGK